MIKGIKKAVTDSRQCEFFRCYYDMETNKVWTCVYSDCNSWDNYHDSNVIEVCSGHGDQSIFGGSHLTMKQLEAAINEALEEQRQVEHDKMYNAE